MGSDNSIVKDYEEKIKDLINEYNDLSCDDRKEKFPEFINKEAIYSHKLLKKSKFQIYLMEILKIFYVKELNI